MASNFPGSADTFATRVDGVDTILAAHVNNLQDAVAAVQTNIGLSAKGSTASLSARLAIALNPDGSLTSASVASIPAGAITETMLADLSVTTNKLAALAVTTAKIANNAVGATQLATSAVTTIKILDANVTNAKIVSLDAAKLTGTVPTAQLGSGTPTAAKFLRGDQTWNQVDYTNLTSVPSTFAPSAHAASHASGGGDPVSLDGSQITAGTVVAARLPSGTSGALGIVQLETDGGTTAGRVVAGDDGRLVRSAVVILCAAFTPTGTGADVGELEVPFHPKDGTTSITWNVRRIWLRVNVAGGAPVAVVEKSTAAGVFSATTVGTLTMVSGEYEVAVTAALGTVASGNKIRFNVTTLASATGWSIGVELGA